MKANPQIKEAEIRVFTSCKMTEKLILAANLCIRY